MDALSELLQAYVNGAAVQRPRCDCGQLSCLVVTRKSIYSAVRLHPAPPEFHRLMELYSRGRKK